MVQCIIDNYTLTKGEVLYMEKNEKRMTYSALTGYRRAVPIILIAVAVYTGLSLFIPNMGTLGVGLSKLLLGLFSYGAYAVPPLMLIQALLYPSDVGAKRVGSRLIFSTLTVIAISCLSYSVEYAGDEVAFSVKEFYANGLNLAGGGAVGGLISYGLASLVSNVGVIIIAVAVLALFLSYFFPGGAKTAKKVGFAIFKGIISFFALIERGLKRLFTSGKRRRQRKSDRRQHIRSIELSQDDFFAVDNGIQALEIPELGIKMTKDGDTIEQRPTLHEKVFPKSAQQEQAPDAEEQHRPNFGAEEQPEQQDRRKVVYGEAFSVYSDLKDDTDTVRKPQSEPIVVESRDSAANPNTPYGEQVRADAQERRRDMDDSADGVFGKDFDPFAMMMNEKLANKPSSKGQDERPPSITEDISELTEEELERARRVRAFEQRKRTIIEMRAKEASPVTNKGEFTGTPKSVDFHQQSNETVSQPKFAPGVSITIDKQERAERAEPVSEQKAYGFSMPDPKPESASRAPADEYNPYSRVAGMHNSRVMEDAREQTPARDGASYSRAAEFVFGAGRQNAPEEEKKTTYTVSEPEYFSPIQKAERPAEQTPPERHEFVFGSDSTPRQEDEVDGEEFTPRDYGIRRQSDTITVSRTPIREEQSRPYHSIDPYLDEDDEDEEEIAEEDLEEPEIEEDFEQIPPERQNPVVKSYRDMFPDLRNEEDDADEEPVPRQEPKAQSREDVPFDGYSAARSEELSDLIEEIEEAPPIKRRADYSDYKTPPIELLGLSPSQNDQEIFAEIQENTNILIETLASFNVTASIKGVDRGPRITRYEVVPAKGVKVNAITHLFDDISLNLAAEGIRMEAPIPGKSAIGFEIPNKRPTDVRLRELLECEEFTSSKSNTFVCIGKDVAGKPIFGDIAKFPHALVAGATGMGKSVCINAIMISILYKARPDQVKFIMIDPKKVEFKLYSGIPHLLIPVITESKQAAGALMWAVEEMERRYDLIEKHSLRNIEGYNEKVAQDPSLGEPLPKIVIVIDELNDLMMQVRDPVEDLIMRIAQKARAAGIHLIIGTQRPDVKVITGTIKANIGTRISCKVTSVMDSRTILDMAGAEKLLNKGDMLFKPTDKTKPIRVQGAFVTDQEADAVMDFLRAEVKGDQYDDEIFNQINKAAQKCGNKKGGAGAEEDMDESESIGCYNDQQFLDAVELAIRSRKVSTSLLQRKLSIGYGKAAKYIDTMMEIGIVSEPNGQKPRDVLITLDEWRDKLARVSLD